MLLCLMTCVDRTLLTSALLTQSFFCACVFGRESFPSESEKQVFVTFDHSGYSKNILNLNSVFFATAHCWSFSSYFFESLL